MHFNAWDDVNVLDGIVRVPSDVKLKNQSGKPEAVYSFSDPDTWKGCVDFEDNLLDAAKAVLVRILWTNVFPCFSSLETPQRHSAYFATTNGYELDLPFFWYASSGGSFC